MFNNIKFLLMERHSNHLNSALIKAVSCAFLSMGCLPMMAETSSLGSDVVAMVQQQVNLRGTVKDANGEPIIGANVLEKGTTNGIITDFDGNFTLSVSKNATLVISYIGYKTIEIPASQAKGGKLDIVLTEDSEALEEVVVIGYGTQKKADVTSALVSQIRARVFDDAAQATVTPADLKADTRIQYGTLDWDNNIDDAGDQTPVYLGGLYDEWGFEFACEAQRRTQMIRFGTYTTKNWFNHTPQGDHVVIFPIPLEELQTNGNLKQNPGY